MTRAEFLLLFILCAPAGVLISGLLRGEQSPVVFGSVMTAVCAPFVLGYVFSNRGQGNG